MTERVVWTYQDYAALPDDGKRYEVRDGVTDLDLVPDSLWPPPSLWRQLSIQP